MGDRFGKGPSFQRQFAGRLPKWNGGFGKARRGEVVGQHLGFGGREIREALLDHACDFAVQLLPAALEQRVSTPPPVPARA